MRDNVRLRRILLAMTLAWGFALVADAAVTSALVFILPIRQYMLVNGALGYIVLPSLALWTAWYGRRQKRLGEARIAAAKAAGTVEGRSVEVDFAKVGPNRPGAGVDRVGGFRRSGCRALSGASPPANPRRG